jgi:hypothetical protein
MPSKKLLKGIQEIQSKLKNGQKDCIMQLDLDYAIYFRQEKNLDIYLVFNNFIIDHEFVPKKIKEKLDYVVKSIKKYLTKLN